eukprot:COSAG01_NODE_3446_length_6086_cov_13.460999_8_plen_184_part_00
MPRRSTRSKGKRRALTGLLSTCCAPPAEPVAAAPASHGTRPGRAAAGAHDRADQGDEQRAPPPPCWPSGPDDAFPPFRICAPVPRQCAWPGRRNWHDRVASPRAGTECCTIRAPMLANASIIEQRPPLPQPHDCCRSRRVRRTVPHRCGRGVPSMLRATAARRFGWAGASRCGQRSRKRQKRG